MNKNYKANLKDRKITEKKRNTDLKEFTVNKTKELLSFLMEDIGYSRNKAKSLLTHRCISVSGAPITQYDFKLEKGDIVIITKKGIRKNNEPPNLKIIYEDNDLIVINKPYGLLSIASDKEKGYTAFRMVTDYVQKQDKHNRVYVVHRIDKETSGILMFVKNSELRDKFVDCWNDIVKKRGYYAIVEGNLKNKSQTIELYLKQNNLNLVYVASSKDKTAKKSITEYKVIKENEKYSLLDVNIHTGRKNQIRVSLGHIGHYVLGDDKYGGPDNPINRLCLHAYELKLIHPITKKEYDFVAPIPKEFNELMR